MKCWKEFCKVYLFNARPLTRSEEKVRISYDITMAAGRCAGMLDVLFIIINNREKYLGLEDELKEMLAKYDVYKIDKDEFLKKYYGER